MKAFDDTMRRRVLVGGVIAAVLFLGGALLSFIGREAPSDDPSKAGTRVQIHATVPSGTTGSVAEHDGMLVGFAHSNDGAVAAAIAYATAPQRWLYFTDPQIRAAIAQIATPVAAPRITEDVVSEVRTARKQLGASPGRVWWLVRPLAWRVEHHEVDEARVSVWAVTILSAAEVAAPQTEWMTVTLDLAWVDGDWRADAVRDAPGPTPTSGPKDQPWDAEPFDQSLAGFTRMDGEPVR